MTRILWLSLALLLGAYISGPLIDPDLWWHITVGRWILAHRELPIVDYWNMFGVSLPWRAYSWSSEVLFAAFELAWGNYGLVALKLAIGMLLSTSIFFVLGRLARNYFVGALIGSFVVSSLVSHFTLRPQSIVWIFFAVLILIADEIRTVGPSKKHSILVFVICALWANTHVTTVLGLLAAALWLFNGRGSIPQITRIMAIGMLGMLATPYFGGDLWSLTSQASHPFAYSSIAEFQPANLQQYAPGITIILLGVYLMFAHKRPDLVMPGQFLAVLFFAFAGFGVIKFLPFAAISIGCGAAVLWRGAGSNPHSLGGLGVSITKLGDLIAKIPPQGLTFVLIAFLIVNVHRVWVEPIAVSRFPIGAMNFLEEKNLELPILNTFGDGGYIMYRLSTNRGEPRSREALVAIDGRTNVSSAAIFKQHSSALRGYTDWREYFNSVNPGSVIWRNESPLVSILLESDEWCMVFKDGTKESGYTVFVKRSFFDNHRDQFESENCK